MGKILGDTTATTMMAEQTYNPQSIKPQSGKAVAEAIAKLLGSAPENLDTLEELAKALNEDENFSASVLAEIAKKADATALANKVDKENGKGLSTNDFTNALKTRLENNTFDSYHSIEYPNDAEEEFNNLLDECTDEGVHLIFIRESDDIIPKWYILAVGECYDFDEDGATPYLHKSLFNLTDGTIVIQDSRDGSGWQKISVSQTDLDNAIGDIETSLEDAMAEIKAPSADNIKLTDRVTGEKYIVYVSNGQLTMELESEVK